MNENTTTGIISNTTGSLFIRILLDQNGPLGGPIDGPLDGPLDALDQLLSILGLRKAPVDQ